MDKSMMALVNKLKNIDNLPQKKRNNPPPPVIISL